MVFGERDGDLHRGCEKCQYRVVACYDGHVFPYVNVVVQKISSTLSDPQELSPRCEGVVCPFRDISYLKMRMPYSWTS